MEQLVPHLQAIYFSQWESNLFHFTTFIFLFHMMDQFIFLLFFFFFLHRGVVLAMAARTGGTLLGIREKKLPAGATVSPSSIPYTR